MRSKHDFSGSYVKESYFLIRLRSFLGWEFNKLMERGKCWKNWSKILFKIGLKNNFTVYKSFEDPCLISMKHSKNFLLRKVNILEEIPFIFYYHNLLKIRHYDLLFFLKSLYRVILYSKVLDKFYNHYYCSKNFLLQQNKIDLFILNKISKYFKLCSKFFIN